MSETKEYQTNTTELQEAITANLKSKKDSYWSGPRNYEVMTPERLLGQVDDIYETVTKYDTDVDIFRFAQACEKGEKFARAAFRNYEYTDGEMYGGPFDSVFAVPLRADGENPVFASDTDAFLPHLSKEFNITPELQLRGVLGLPPTVIELNDLSEGKGERGATIFAPLFTTMIQDYRTDPAKLIRVGSEIMQKAAELAHIRLGAKVLGLGATFPKISGYGAMFKNHENHDMGKLVTTTGHGGTVFLINETIKALQETETYKNKDISLGVVGAAGSIGWSTIESALELVGDFDLYTNDFRSTVLADKIQKYETSHNKKIHQSESAVDVLKKCDIVISAVTRAIDLDIEDPLDERIPMQERSLYETVIVDDSEPKAFRRDQVEARGGRLITVAGKGGPNFAALRRRGFWTGGPHNPYNFGDEAGLYDGASWGCDIERAVLSWAGAYNEAVVADVTPANVRNIGRLCLEAGVSVAQFQIDTQPVRIP